MKLSDWMVLGVSTYPLCRGQFFPRNPSDDGPGCLLTVTALATGFKVAGGTEYTESTRVCQHLGALFPALDSLTRDDIWLMYDERSGPDKHKYTEADVIEYVRALEAQHPDRGWDWEPPAHDNTEALRKLAAAVEDPAALPVIGASDRDQTEAVLGGASVAGGER